MVDCRTRQTLQAPCGGEPAARIVGQGRAIEHDSVGFLDDDLAAELVVIAAPRELGLAYAQLGAAVALGRHFARQLELNLAADLDAVEPGVLLTRERGDLMLLLEVLRSDTLFQILPDFDG